jgi:hypothetical protein
MIELTSLGITQTELTCTEDVNTSDFGLYLDQLPGFGKDFHQPNTALTCDSTYVTRMVTARQQAINLTKEAIYKAVTSNTPVNKQKWEGYIGQRSGIGAAPGNTATLQSATLQDAYFLLTDIGVIASGIGTATVTITSTKGYSKTVTLDVSTNGFTGSVQTERLPLDGSIYTIETEVTGTVQLQRNAIGCGCGRKDTDLFSMLKPTGSTLNGVTLAAKLVLNPQEAITRIYNADTDVQKVVAYTAYFQAGVLLCDAVLGQSQPDETDTNLEYVNARRGEFVKEVNERLLWLTETGFDVSGSYTFAPIGARRVSL